MHVESMTGFARHTANAGRVAIVWELKSVNGKSLDIALPLPLRLGAAGASGAADVSGGLLARQCSGGFDAGCRARRETALSSTKRCLQQFERLSPTFPRASASRRRPSPTCCRFPAFCSAARRRRTRRLSPPSLTCLDQAMSALKQARQSEGAALEAILLGHLNTVERADAQGGSRSRAPAGRHPRPHRREHRGPYRRSARAGRDRLASEALFVANRADIREEIDRLKTHVKSAGQLLSEWRRGGAQTWIFWRRNLTARQTLCAQNPMPPRSRRLGLN